VCVFVLFFCFLSSQEICLVEETFGVEENNARVEVVVKKSPQQRKALLGKLAKRFETLIKVPTNPHLVSYTSVKQVPDSEKLIITMEYHTEQVWLCGWFFSPW
jgi:hypothetical protein